VFWLWRDKPYDRTTSLAAGDKARGLGRLRKAISDYLKILAHQPDDYQVHARVAPLLARRHRWDEARKSFEAAAGGYMKAGFADKAIAVWTVAAQHFPEENEYWEHIANEQVRRGRRADAVQALMHGRQWLRARRQRPMAIMLLRQVLALQAGHFDATVDLALQLGREGQTDEGRRLLAELSLPTTRAGLRRLRAAQLRLSPGLKTFLAWLRAR
jgi:tetratricopeptide (TPR) repeat protein